MIDILTHTTITYTKPCISKGLRFRQGVKNSADTCLTPLTLPPPGPRGKLAEACQRFGIEYQTAADAARVCRAFESSRRLKDLTFTHHQSVAGRPDADELLRWASERGATRARKLAEACQRFGIEYDSARKAAYVCGTYESGRRLPDLTFGHHEAVAGRPDADELLQWASERGATVKARQLAHTLHPRGVGVAVAADVVVDASGRPRAAGGRLAHVEGPPRSWVLTRENA